MKKRISMTTTILAGLLLTGCAAATVNWQAHNYNDDFTNDEICRVERGSASQREFVRHFIGTYFTHHFYAENYNGEVRAGVRSEPAIPIGGDIQLKVGETLYTMTSNDTPLDIAPAMPSIGAEDHNYNAAYAETMKNMAENVQKLASPYRAYAGQKAKRLLKDIINTGGEVKYRLVGINTANSTTGSFTATDNFVRALEKCGIDIE